ncbi:MAG: GDYXXLXY domain-containing protein [Verrucomicrobiota bacterium]
MKTAKWFWALVAAQALFLGAWAGYHEWIRQHASTILLKTVPVDPQDLLRGDYMILGYEIGRPPASVTAKEGFDDVWVLLEKREGYHAIVEASATRLTPKAGQVLVRGTLGPEWRRGAGGQRISYGIERYFVPEGKGTPRFTRMEVEASVSPEHRLYIRRLLLDGKSYP